MEVDVDVVVDREAGQLLDRLDRQLRAAERVGGVDLVVAVTGDLDLQVARQREQRDSLAGVEPHDHDRVRARLEAELLVAVPAVGADEQDRLRLAARQHRRQLLARVDAT